MNLRNLLKLLLGITDNYYSCINGILHRSPLPALPYNTCEWNWKHYFVFKKQKTRIKNAFKNDFKSKLKKISLRRILLFYFNFKNYCSFNRSASTMCSQLSSNELKSPIFRGYYCSINQSREKLMVKQNVRKVVKFVANRCDVKRNLFISLCNKYVSKASV